MLKSYIRWSLHQLFLLYFQPSLFEREVEGTGHNQPKMTWQKRLRYMLKMLPCVLASATLGNFLAGHLCESFGIRYQWLEVWQGIALGVGFGVAVGVALWA